MSLQKKLAYLLVAFTGFTLAATFATIYGVRLHIENATAGLQRSLDEALWVDRLQLEAREQRVALREIVDGTRAADELYGAQRDGFFLKLDQVVRYGSAEPQATEALHTLAAQLRQACERCLDLVNTGEGAAAHELFNNDIDGRLLPALELRLREVRSALDDARNRAVDELVATHTHVLILAVLVGAFGVGLVAVGTALFRRWVVLPIRRFQQATQEFAGGNLEYRLVTPTRDEFGALGQAMNQMAGSLSAAQTDLRVSEAKYRSLFENLQDALVICDAHGRVIECHDGDTGLLGAQRRDAAGRPLLEVWPEWRAAAVDWPALILRVLNEQTRVRIPELELSRGQGAPAVVDLTAYPVEYGAARYAALALRDVTARWQLQRQARRTEAMEATVTFARGVAHDFNNLLTSVIASLSPLKVEITDGKLAERVRRALLACRQAAGLAKKLLSFAGGDPGDPQLLCLRETVVLILESFDEEFFQNIRVRREGNGPIPIRIDRDQLTQIVLNLVHNAREAMPAGGELLVNVGTGRPPSAQETHGPHTHAVLTVADTGCGIAPEVRERLFEPFFSTKAAGVRRSRGMGLAVVYAAVKNAAGHIDVASEPGAGTTIHVYLPLEKRTAELQGSASENA
jgi:PAS domain S-box-containing protein